MPRQSRRCSIADARNNFPRLVHEVERGTSVELIRRVKPVAVLVTGHEYDRLSQDRPDFWKAYIEGFYLLDPQV
jgi:prevent-host-death family protein